MATCFVYPFVFVETLTLCSQDEDVRLNRFDFVMLFLFWLELDEDARLKRCDFVMLFLFWLELNPML